MKKYFLTAIFVLMFFVGSSVSASAVVNDTVKVGLKYGTNAMYSANLENQTGKGYSFGYFDDDREFIALGETDVTTISMTAAGTIYMNSNGIYSAENGNTVIGPWRVQISGFDSFDEASAVADELGGWPAWIDEAYVVRVGPYNSRSEAEDALEQYLPQEEPEEPETPEGTDEPETPEENEVTEEPQETEDNSEAVVESVEEMLQEGEVLEETLLTMSLAEELEFGVEECSATAIVVTKTQTTKILFEYDYWGIYAFGVMPNGNGKEPVTWFKGYKYYGGFEYARITGGDLNVCNLVDLEDYVRCVVPHEMSSSWGLEALKAQAVCARTYVIAATKHRSQGFDVCSTTDCQAYYGLSGSAARTDTAVKETEGQCLYYGGKLAGQAVYHASNGGGTEDVTNIWGGNVAYLVGKEDPYEAMITIPNYKWSVTYTAQELTWILEQKGYNVGTVKNVYVSEYTPLGNVKKLTIEGSRKTQTVSGNTCSTIFYSSTYNKSVKSMRFGINGGGPVSGTDIYVNNNKNLFSTLKGIFAISGTGKSVKLEGGKVSVLTSSGLQEIVSDGWIQQSSNATDGKFVFAGSGSGHNVGMSQYGAKAMAENGYDYEEILTFYYTGVSVR